MEINPNHPMTEAVRDQWHKIAVLLMAKFNQQHVEITVDEIIALSGSHLSAVAIQTKDDRIIPDLVTWDEARELAKKEGGLPH